MAVQFQNTQNKHTLSESEGKYTSSFDHMDGIFL